jgi:hypothetical protein
VGENARAVLDAAPFRVRGSEVQPPDARERYCGRAHRAWLERDVEIAISEPLGAERRASGADGQQFGVCGRVFEFPRPVAGGRQNSAVGSHHDRPDGHLFPGARRGSFIERTLHVVRRREGCHKERRSIRIYRHSDP